MQSSLRPYTAVTLKVELGLNIWVAVYEVVKQRVLC